MTRSIEDELSERGFCKFLNLYGRYSIANNVPKSQISGIYVLTFADGAFYAGQSINIPQRYAQHRLVHPDIKSICWKAVNPTQLDQEERETIRLIESLNDIIRNVQYTSFPTANSAFEVLMPRESQLKYLNDSKWVDPIGNRVSYPQLESRTQAKFSILTQSEDYNSLVAILGRYISQCVPSPRKTEVAYWSLSCSTGRQTDAVVSRLNVGWQEVLTVWNEEGHWYIYFQVRRSIIGPAFSELLKFRRRHRGCRLYRSSYSAGGSDQLRIESAYLDDTMKLLDDVAFVLAARHLNVTLASKSGCMWSRSHCPQLADAAMAAGQ